MVNMAVFVIFSHYHGNRVRVDFEKALRLVGGLLVCESISDTEAIIATETGVVVFLDQLSKHKQYSVFQQLLLILLEFQSRLQVRQFLG